MVPPKKKRKVLLPKPDDENAAATAAAAKDQIVGNVQTSSKTTAKAQISHKDLLTKQLISQLDALESSGGPSTSFTNDSGVSMGLLKLKSLQRGVLERVRKTQEKLRQQAIVRDRQEAKLDNLHYQHKMYQARQQQHDCSIEELSKDIATMVRKDHSTNIIENKPKDEPKSEDPEGRTKEDINNDTELLRKFFGENWKDPSKKQAIISKLNLEVATRKKLKATLHQLTIDQKSKQDSLASREKLLRDLPAKLADMERASLPLQKFFQKHQSGTLMQANPQLGTTQRRARLDMATTLSKSLYTIFHQLQSCLDAMENMINSKSHEKFMDIVSEALPTVEIEGSPGMMRKNNESAVVVLNIPIPTRSSDGVLSYQSKKQASIGFRYYDVAGVILAACGTDHGMGQFVIDELFPGDTGCSALAMTTKTPLSSQASPPPGRAYQWCNYLGGLHTSPADQTTAKTYSSTRVIIWALLRRVRATATLSWIMQDLSSRPNASNLPRHAALDDREKNSANSQSKQDSSEIRLSSWKALPADFKTSENRNGGNENDDNQRHVRVYKATFQKGNGKSSKKLIAKVSFNRARYPSCIPHWKILRSSYSDQEDDEKELEPSLDALEGDAPQQLPLYNEELARYDKALSKLEEDVNSKVDRLVDSSDQTTYDWVLAQQLVEIAKGWEISLREDTPEYI